MLELNINTDAVVAFTNTLEKISKSALPVAIRTALNSAAFDMKKKTLLNSASSAFENRSSNFFKAFSKVEMAKGFDVATMHSTVGFVEHGLKGGKNYAVKDLQQQEEGGRIGGKTFIPLNAARKGNTYKGNVAPRNRISKIQNIINSRNAKGVNDKQKFIKSVFFAGRGGYVSSDFKGKRILFRVNSLNRTNEGGFKLTALYSTKTGRSVTVKRTHFAQKAALISAEKIEQFYITEAKKQIDKLK